MIRNQRIIMRLLQKFQTMVIANNIFTGFFIKKITIHRRDYKVINLAKLALLKHLNQNV